MIVQEEIEMQDRKKLLAMHRYKITQGEDGYWRTYLPDESKKSGRRQLKKIAASTHERNCQIFKRHYKEFGKNRIKQEEPEEFSDFLEEQIVFTEEELPVYVE